MPTYEYKCDGCGHCFEEFQSITAEPVGQCPQCQKNKVRRLIGSGSGLIFKGSGFYQTDYRSESYKKDAKADKTASEPVKSTSGKGSSDKKTDSTKKTVKKD